MLARLAAASSVAFLLVATMVLGVAAPAQAIGWGNLDPRRFMVNMLGSVMSAAGDTDWKRAIIAGQAVYDHSFEGIEAKFNAPSSSGAPKTATDYQLDRLNFYNEKNITSNSADIGTVNNTKNYVKTQKMPLGLPQKLVKAGKVVGGVAGPTVAITGWMYRADIGRFASGLVGLNNTDASVCGYNDNYSSSAAMVSFITGVNCDAFKLARDYIPNVDIVPRPKGWSTNLIATGFSSTGDHYFSCQIAELINPSQSTELTCQVLRGTQSQGGVLDMSSLYCRNTSTNVVALSGRVVWRFAGDPTYRAGTYTTGKATIACAVGSVPYSYLQDGKGADGAPDSPTANGTRSYPEWFSPQSQYGSRYPGVVADPARTIQCSVTGTNGITYTADSAPFTEGSGSTGNPKCPGLPEGVGARDVSVKEKVPGQTDKELMKQNASPAYVDMYARFPECVDGHCKLDLIDNRTKASCFSSTSAATACAAWLAEPNKAVDYQCKYGKNNVTLNECYVYGDVFKADRVAAGQAYTDPLTGLPVVSGQSSPSAGNTAMGRPALDPQDAYGCMGAGWAEANPIEWVLVPLQCSLQWAFVPSPTTTTFAGQRIATEWGKSAPGQLIAAVAAWNITFQVNGCGGVPFPFKYGPVNVDIGIPSACSGTPLAPFAAVVRSLGVLGFVLGSVMVIRKHAGSSIGFGG